MKISKTLKPVRRLTFKSVSQSIIALKEGAFRVSTFRKDTVGKRVVATTCLAAVLYSLVLPGPYLMAQTFDEFDTNDRSTLERYVDRADRLDDADAWTNYVELGIATLLIDWEDEAYDQLSARINEIDTGSLTETEKEAEKDFARQLYNAARLDWEADAEDFLFEQRGAFLADRTDLGLSEIETEEYLSALAAADAAVAADSELNLTLWDSVIVAELGDIRANFLTLLDSKFNDALLDAIGLNT
ncbi:MAG: hypothetical protein KDK30_16105, partial [Leptospiraceae bacterium]|nr:hypothetical protein [Leptospiraceae bacterium]